MSDATLSFARALRRHAQACAKFGKPVTLVYDPITSAHIADMIERGCQRSDYVRTVQQEAERLRDAAEELMLAAQDANEAADRALERAEAYRRRMLAVTVGVIGGLVLAVLA